MGDKSLNAIAGAAKMMADSARSMESVMEDMENSVASQNLMLGAFVDRLDELIKKMGASKSAEKAGPASKGGSAFSSLKGLGDIKKETGENLKSMGEGLTSFSKGLLDFSKTALKFMMVPEKVLTSMTDFIVGLAEKLAKIDGKKIDEGATGLSNMASAIALFGLTLALSAPVYLIAALGTLVILPVIGAFAWTFAMIGKAAESIDKGAKAIAWMGLAIASFGLAMWITKSLVGGDWKGFAIASLVVIGALSLFSITFYLIGGFADPIEKGAKAVAWMGLAIVSIGIGLALFQAFSIGMGTILVAAAAVALLGISFGIAGVFGSLIEAGALPLAMAGLALIVLALGIGSFRLFGIQPADYLNSAAAVVAVGGSMAIAGLMAPLILLGAASLIVAGVSLLFLALGLTVMNAVYSKAIDGILAPSLNDPNKTNLDVVIGSMVSAFAISPIDAVKMFVGAASLMVASIALITLSFGLSVMNSMYTKSLSGLLAPSSNPDYKTNLDYVVGSVVDAFTINPVKSVMMLVGAVGLIFASVAMITLAGGIFVFNKVYQKIETSGLFKPNAQNPDATNFEHTMDAIVNGMVISPMRLIGLYAAVPAWIMTGIGLITIATGLAKFANIIEKNLDINKVGDMVTKVLTTVAECLISVGNGDTVDWDAVEDGISAVSGVGNVLSSIADGVSKMATLKIPIYDKNGNVTSYITIGDKQFQQVTINMKKIINAVVGTLTEIGKSQGETSWFSKTAGEKGADTIRGIGQDLVGLADFVQKAANLTFPIYDSNGKEIGRTTITPDMLEKGGSVYRNIVSMITAVTGALGDIGSGAAAQGGWFVDSDIEKGKAAIAGIAGDLKGIADLVTSVANVKDFGVVDTNIRRILILIPNAMLGAAAVIDKNKAKLLQTGAYINKIMEPISAIIDALAKVVEKKISEKDGMVLGKSIQTLISSFDGIKPDANYDNFKKAVEYIEKLAGTADPMDRLAKSFERIAKTMNTFGMAFKKMDKGTLQNSNMLIQSLTVFSKVDPNSLNALSDKGKLLIKYIYENGGPTKTPPTAPTPAPTANTSQAGTTESPKLNPQAQAKSSPAAPAFDMTQMYELMGQIAAKLGILEDINDKLGGTLKVTEK